MTMSLVVATSRAMFGPCNKRQIKNARVLGLYDTTLQDFYLFVSEKVASFPFI